MFHTCDAITFLLLKRILMTTIETLKALRIAYLLAEIYDSVPNDLELIPEILADYDTVYGFTEENVKYAIDYHQGSSTRDINGDILREIKKL